MWRSSGFLLLLVVTALGASCAAEPLNLEGIEERTVDVRGMVFDARTAGPEDGPLVMMLHGFPQTSFEWRGPMQVLAAEGYRVVAPNQRGYSAGARPDDVEDYGAAALVDDVVGMADALGAERFDLAGHDWGAVVAWGVAAQYPERVRSLTAVSVPHPDAFDDQLEDESSCQYGASSYIDFFNQEGSEDQLLAAGAAGLRAVYGDLHPEAVDDYLNVLGEREALTAGLNWYRANIFERRVQTDRLGAVDVDTLMIWSDGDSAICREGVDATAAMVTGDYRLEVLEGVDHWIPERAPVEVSTWMLEHLANR